MAPPWGFGRRGGPRGDRATEGMLRSGHGMRGVGRRGRRPGSSWWRPLRPSAGGQRAANCSSAGATSPPTRKPSAASSRWSRLSGERPLPQTPPARVLCSPLRSRPSSYNRPSRSPPGGEPERRRDRKRLGRAEPARGDLPAFAVQRHRPRTACPQSSDRPPQGVLWRTQVVTGPQTVYGPFAIGGDDFRHIAA